MSKIKWNITLSAAHEQLKATNSTLHRAMTDKTPVSGTDTHGDMKANTLAVDLKFYLSDPSKHGKSAISLPVFIPGYNYFAVANMPYDEEAQLESVQARHKIGFDPHAHTSETQKNGPKSYAGTPTLHTAFHHSEQAFYEYITQRNNLDDIALRLKNHGVYDHTKITAMTINMHSIRYICGNCETSGFGLIKDSRFRSNLSQALKHKGLELDKDARFNIQTSVDRPCKGYPVELLQHDDVDLYISKNTITSSDTTRFTFSPRETDLHNRTIMISTNPTDLTKKCRAVFDDIRQKEYESMLEAGRVIYEEEPANLHGYSICRAISEHTRLSAHDILPSHEQRLDAFIALAYLAGINDNIQSMTPRRMGVNDIAAKIVRVRDSINADIAEEKQALEGIKNQFLKLRDEIQEVQGMSTNLLRAIGMLQDEYQHDNQTIWDALRGDHYEEHGTMTAIYENLSFAIVMLGMEGILF